MTSKIQMLRSFTFAVASIFFCAATCFAQESVDYAKDIKPLLAENCFACHGTDAETRAADLRLDEREAAIDAGAIEPGDADASTLVERLYEEDPDVIMPPPKSGKKLTPEEKDLLKRWIEEGAEYSKHWSLIAPTKVELPKVKNAAWAKTEIDRFVLARLEAEGLQPAEEADARTLFRRVHLDISGLPPSETEISAFEKDFAADGDKALSQWIDKLMERETWGEHRARYWLDAARYADTHGMHFDNYREMWPYRDWVIRAFNKNMPFDKFTIEQLAGDLLENPTDEQLIATGFQRCNMTTNEGGTIAEENRAIYAADRVQTFGWVYLGLTTNCCQCHDHKFDPLTAKDYYSLAAFFRNTTEPALDGNVKDGKSEVLKVFSEKDRKRLKAIKEELVVANKAKKDYRDSSSEKFQSWMVSLADKKPEEKIGPGVAPILHVPLNEGKGKSVSASVGLDAPVVAKKDFKWAEEGKLGPSIVLKPTKTVNLGEFQDFTFEESFSFGAWVKAPKKFGGAAIFAKMDEGAKHRGWDLWHQNGQVGAHMIDQWPGNALKVRTKKDVTKVKEWQHLFVTYDGSKKPEGIRVYVDGELHETETEMNSLKPEAKLDTKTPLKVGQRSGGAVFDGGQVQDVRIYDKSLSADEVKAVMAIGAKYVEALISIPADQRTAGHEKALLNHYLNKVDESYPALAKAVTDLQQEREKINKETPITHIQKEKPNSMAKTNILMRGAYDKLGEEVVAATPEVLHAMPEGASPNRLGLAKWVIDPANPLTTRVTVNRFWQEIFGKGIVATSEDFGVMGTPPSNQELLDWIAVDFRESGWDVKRFYKKMLMSSTYRQKAKVTPDKLLKDEDNSLLSRGPRFRMDAEMVRDYALVASGLFNEKMYGPGAKPYQPDNIWNVVGLPSGDTREYVQDKGDNVYRRSLYSFWKRMSPPPNLEAFNAPNREVCTVRRERTNTPLQALVTLNDPQFFEAARVLAENGIKKGQDNWNDSLDFVSSQTVCRKFSDVERQIIKDDFNAYFDFYREKPEEAKKLLVVGQAESDKSLDVAQLAAWTMVCNSLLNLDEVLNK
jgi:cytochrome c553